MAWAVIYTREAKQDLQNLDHSQRLPVLKAIQKVADNPLPRSEGGYGKPLGNHASFRLAGYLKITLMALGLRVV
jgi:mRNA interferase RelE/StbE